jgi:hypothetical protein
VQQRLQQQADGASDRRLLLSKLASGHVGSVSNQVSQRRDQGRESGVDGYIQGGMAIMQEPQSSPLPEKLEPLAEKFPPLGTPVIVTMADGTEFCAIRIFVEDDEGGSTAWATADEHEPNCPDCWDDGVCWQIAADGLPSRQPVAWRHI